VRLQHLRDGEHQPVERDAEESRHAVAQRADHDGGRDERVPAATRRKARRRRRPANVCTGGHQCVLQGPPPDPHGGQDAAEVHGVNRECVERERRAHGRSNAPARSGSCKKEVEQQSAQRLSGGQHRCELARAQSGECDGEYRYDGQRGSGGGCVTQVALKGSFASLGREWALR